VLNQVANPNSTHINSMSGLTRTSSATAGDGELSCGV
jgi:hypothetical protein